MGFIVLYFCAAALRGPARGVNGGGVLPFIMIGAVFFKVSLFNKKWLSESLPDSSTIESMAKAMGPDKAQLQTHEWFVVWHPIWRSFQVPVQRSVLKLGLGSRGLLNIEITQLGFLRFKIHSHFLLTTSNVQNSR